MEVLNSRQWLNSQPRNEWLRVDNIPWQIFWSVWDLIERNRFIKLKDNMYNVDY